MSWDVSIRSYFADREELDISALCREFGLSLRTKGATLQECLLVFEQEYEVKMGFFRAADRLEVFTSPPPTHNPIRWLLNQAAIEDKASELSFRLKQQRKRLAVAQIPPHPPQTLRDYMLAWLGIDDRQEGSRM